MPSHPERVRANYQSLDQADSVRDALVLLLSRHDLRWRYKPYYDYYECRSCGTRMTMNFETGAQRVEGHSKNCPWFKAELALQG